MTTDIDTDGTVHAAGSAPTSDAPARTSWQREAGLAEERADALARRAEALERALDSRPMIDQAKGVIMGVFGIGADAAFDALVWASQHGNLKLSVVAERFMARIVEVEFDEGSRDQVTRTLARAVDDDEPYRRSCGDWAATGSGMQASPRG